MGAGRTRVSQRHNSRRQQYCLLIESLTKDGQAPLVNITKWFEHKPPENKLVLHGVRRESGAKEAILDRMGRKLTAEWRTQHNEELHDLY